MSEPKALIAVVTEKPAVARDIAKVLGARQRGEGYLQGNGYIITWAIGHLVTLAQPHEINPDWKRWRQDTLPMLPEIWPLIISEKTHEQFQVVKKIINADAIEQIVCATDAGREGELIFRYIYEAAGCRKPVKRLWISSLTTEAIREGFAHLREGRDFDPLAAAARGRSQADWLVGMNLSRACTLAFGQALNETLSVGRVQTPTLAMVVEREQAIRRFVPEDYLEVVATFSPVLEHAGKPSPIPAAAPTYQGTWFRGAKPDPQAKRLAADGVEAAEIVRRARAGEARVESKRAETKRLPPPLFYDLTELQRHANRLYGFSAQKTLDIAQQLYEQKKLISYPRTDSRHLSQDVAASLNTVIAAIRPPYEPLLAPGSGERPLGKRFVDDAKVTDHHAIIPTTVPAASVVLSAEEKKILDLICRRVLAAWHEDHVWSVTTVITAIRSPTLDVEAVDPIIDRYHSTGSVVEQMGWKVLDPWEGKATPARKTKGQPEPEAQALPPGLTEWQHQQVLDAKAVKKQTRPPPRFTEATLLTAMETAGRALDDKELSAAMKESGLGTPATRAEIIETLLRREYLTRKGKTLEASDKGIRLIERVHPEVKSPAMTGQWEAQLKRIQRGEGELGVFMKDIENYVQNAVGKVLSSPPGLPLAKGEEKDSAPAINAVTNRSPTSVNRLGDLLRDAFGLSTFRPYQEAVCQAVTEGRDVLLVMPTGAGKSLCYQLPGLARAGTTLVVSPLIALMEDQVAKLRDLGIRADRIHSGRDRPILRQVCVEYLAGRLDFLFIAPERLSVPGFPEMLAKRRPSLIAVDEAHCISHWGHDFRPDYRMLGQRLPLLRPAPVIALTATATPLVQDDILSQLGIGSAGRYIHGFRRTNIAVEIVELKRSARAAVVRQVLADPERRPAIVYAPTRKEADALGAELQTDFPAAAYHAGMTAADRDRVQARFLAGKLEVIVATIAFGMGVDKADVRTVIHTGLPSSVEGYYQEIGRAGRDGKPSRAILFYSYADRRTHEFFQERDYPDRVVLEKIFSALGTEPQPKYGLLSRLNMDPEVFDRALEKLWVHGGALIDPAENVARGKDGWQQPYQEQSDHKLAQLDQMMRCVKTHQCRMLYLVCHFGDQEDSGEPCGVCDVCAPASCAVRRFRGATPDEAQAVLEILEALRRRDGQGTGQLFRQTAEGSGLDRRSFERILGGIVGAGLVQISEDTFEKEGRTIHFQRAFITEQGRRAGTDAGKRVRFAEDMPVTSRTRAARKKTAARQLQDAQPQAEPTLVEALKAWRLQEARRRQIPAFRILTDRTLLALAAARPADEQALLAITGIGPALVDKYGRQILAIVHDA